MIFQSGGPTAVLNASLVGSIRAARQAGFERILGSKHGVQGLLDEEFVDLTDLTDGQLHRLRRTPSAGLGSSRHRPDAKERRRILDVCAQYDVQGVVAIGGNDTADTVWQLVKTGNRRGAGPNCISVPKTIDNDLVGTDHSLGYPSNARYLALSVRDAAFDTMAMRMTQPVKIVEVMGRNAGWLAAAGTLAFPDDLPNPIVCLPERPLDGPEDLCQRVQARIDSHGWAVVIVPETMRWADGSHVAGDTPEWVDAFGHPYFSSAGLALSRLFSQELGVRSRYDQPGTIARMAMHAVSEIDLAEAEQAGIEAVAALGRGESGQMIALERVSSDPYRVRYGLTPVSRVANKERRVPDEMIGPDGASLTNAFRAYALPLMGEPFPEYEMLFS